MEIPFKEGQGEATRECEKREKIIKDYSKRKGISYSGININKIFLIPKEVDG